MGIHTVKLKAADGQIGDDHIMQFIERDAGLQAAATGLVRRGDAAGLTAEVNLAFE